MFRTTSGWRWHPDADSVNAPDGVLLHATNTIPDATGARVLRRGSRDIYTGFADLNVNALYSPILQGTKYRFAGVDDQVYRDGMSFGTAFDGSGDISFGDDAYQAFFARGTTKKKFDGSNFYNWGIDAPAYAPTLSAIDAITETVATFDSGESPAFTIHEGTSNFVSDYDGNANSALELIPSSDAVASASKKFSSDQDYLDIGGSVGSNTDLFDVRVHLAKPKKVDKVTIMFGLGTGTDPFVDDYYYFDFDLKNDVETGLKDPRVNSVDAYTASTERLLSVLTPDEVTNVRSPAVAGDVVKRLTELRGGTTVPRRDTQSASPAWGHFTVSRGQFKRVGTTSGRNWKTVRGFKIAYNVSSGSTDSAYFDDAIWTGGGARSLNGNFRVGYRYARQYLDAAGAEIYTELSPMSPISDDLNLAQQTLQVTIPAAALTAKDAQVDQIWIYMYGGWLDTYYRVAITNAAPASGMTIDEISSRRGGTTNFDQPEERARLTSHGFSLAPGAGSGSSDLQIAIFKSELDALIENEPFEPGSVGPPDNVIGIAGPWRKRMFVLTSEGWLYVSSGKRPSSFSVYHAIDLRRYGDPYWVIEAGEQIYIGCSKDIIRIAGSGNLDAGGVLVDLYPQEMSVANPPVDASAATDGNAIIYRSGDGPMMLNGASLQPIPFAGTSLLWKNRERHNIEPLNTLDGRFRFEVDNHNLYMLAPEGEDSPEIPSKVWKYMPDHQQWCRFDYEHGVLSIWREYDGTLLVGTSDGRVREIESGTGDNEGGIYVDILTPIDDGGNALGRKDAADLQIHVDTGGSVGRVEFFNDGDTLGTTSVLFTTTQEEVYRASLASLGTFLKTQANFTGSFTSFSLQAFGISYRQRPQQVMRLDTGHIIPPEGGDLAWINQVELDTYSPVDLQMLVYKNGTLHDTVPITVDPNERDVYTLVPRRGTKGRRLQLIFVTTNNAGQGDVGFEPYGIRVRHVGTGNWTELPVGSGDGGNVSA